MKCPRCQRDNPIGQNFCGDCGARLALVCPTCGETQPGHHRYCGECGASLAAATAFPDTLAQETAQGRRLTDRLPGATTTLQEERKQVTVLFADVRSSLELLGDRDPEEARALLDPVLKIMIEAVHHYEGTVNQIMGDGIMALFGAPVAHEDHAVRACYAALRMQDAVTRHSPDAGRLHGIQVTMRVGLNSGEVVVRSIGSDLRTDYSAVGQTTHLAARMEQMAPAGSILATASTVDLASGHIEVSALGLRPVKGLDAPIEVYLVTGTGPVRSALEVAATRGLTPLVGRDAEIAELDRTLDLVAGGRGQVVTVVGEPGVGKSRLVHEFASSDRMRGWLILKTTAVSYNKTTVYRPVTDLLRGYFRIYDRDNLETLRDKVSRKIQELGGGLAAMWPAFLALLEAPVDDPEWRSLDPRRRRQQTMDAVRRLLFRESQIQPVCLIVEDLQWVDSETQALLDSLVESLPSTKLLLLVNFRPEYRHAWAGRTYFQLIRIDPLRPPDAEALLRALVGDHAELGPFRHLLIEQTLGNPYFLEESVRALAEDGVLVGQRGAYRLARPVEEIRVPGTIQAVLAARIDRLPPTEKHLLQCAAVVGETVPYALLEAIADLPDSEIHGSLDGLRAAEFLYYTSLFPEPEYCFKHGLVRRVTYDSLLRDRRRLLHARIVDAIERLHSGRLVEH
ncbi:MAG TPA: adenylate/guanylate cyclase domain-containing protein, partial [Candidatus Methylomirabilis sp.]|nr:adenylate/guanylate cyclase domain-containing protein [Candidatus Methylomirabilis sp.]